MKILTTALLAGVLFLGYGCGDKDGLLLWPLLGNTEVTPDGGNQGVPSGGTNNDPAPTVTSDDTGSSGSGSSSGSSQTVADVIASQPTTQDGTSTSPDIFVENGVIVGNLDGGSLTTSGGTEVQVVEDGSLTGSVTVNNTNENTTVDGTTTVVGDDFVFVPNDPLGTDDVYQVTITDGDGNTTNENVFLAVDNTCNAQSTFSSVELYGGQNYNVNLKDKVITDNNSNKKAVFGWNFAQGNFSFRINNKTAGVKYVLTAYGVYDITGHTCEVYFQRWSSNNEPVENFDITGFGGISVTPTDSSLPKPGGGYYDFAKTYVQLNAIDSLGNDVTETDGATLAITHVASSAALIRGVKNGEFKRLGDFKYAKPYKQVSGLYAYLGKNRMNWILVLLVTLVAFGGFFMANRFRRGEASARK